MDMEWLQLLFGPHAEQGWQFFVAQADGLIMQVLQRMAGDAEVAAGWYGHIIDALEEDRYARLRQYDPDTDGVFEAWLTVVVGHMATDEHRRTQGRPRHRAPAGLSAVGLLIWRYVILAHRSQIEGYEIIVAQPEHRDLTWHAYCLELQALYRSLDDHGRTGLLAASGKTYLPPQAIPDEFPIDALEQMVEEEREAALHSALAQLDSITARAVWLHVEGKTAPEIAAAVGWTPRQVYRWVPQALARLKRDLEDHGITED